jgi:hypothetical protein
VPSTMLLALTGGESRVVPVWSVRLKLTVVKVLPHWRRVLWWSQYAVLTSPPIFGVAEWVLRRML